MGLAVARGCCRLGVTWSEKVVGTHEKALAGEIHQGKNTHPTCGPTRGQGGGWLSLPLGATGTRTTAWDSPGAGTPALGLQHPPPLFWRQEIRHSDPEDPGQDVLAAPAQLWDAWHSPLPGKG